MTYAFTGILRGPVILADPVLPPKKCRQCTFRMTWSCLAPLKLWRCSAWRKGHSGLPVFFAGAMGAAKCVQHSLNKLDKLERDPSVIPGSSRNLKAAPRKVP